MTTEIRIDSCTLSKSGKSYAIMSGGQKYYCKAEQGLHDLPIHTVIEAETTTSDYKGTAMVWINAYMKGARQDAVVAPKVFSASPQMPSWSPMASNVLAHAIQAGLITTPEQMAAWVFSVRNIMEHKINETIPKDDDALIPF